MLTLANVGLLISLAFPLVISVYKETRFVIGKNLLIYGVSLITFTLSYSAYELPLEYAILRYLSWIFLIIGVAMVYFYFQPDNNPIPMDQNPISLIFSWKNYGAFELAFVTPLFLNDIPVLFAPTSIAILDLGINLLFLLWLASFGFFAYRNWIR